MSLFEMWKTFFTEAGIPTTECLSYAGKFAKNRIHMNMLPELNREYLKDMGITLMGDIIAILRHSKVVYEEKNEKTDTTAIENNDSKPLPKLASVCVAVEPSIKRVINNTPKPEQAERIIVKGTAPLPPLKRKASNPPPAASQPKKLETAPPPKRIAPSKVSPLAATSPHLVVDDEVETYDEMGYFYTEPSNKNNNKSSGGDAVRGGPSSAPPPPSIIEPKKQQVVTAAAARVADLQPDDESDEDSLNDFCEDEDDNSVNVIVDEIAVSSFTNYKVGDYYGQEYYIPKKHLLPEMKRSTIFERLGEETTLPSVTSTTGLEDEERSGVIMPATVAAAAAAAKKMSISSEMMVGGMTKVTQDSVFRRLGDRCIISSNNSFAKNVANKVELTEEPSPPSLEGKFSPQMDKNVVVNVPLNRKNITRTVTDGKPKIIRPMNARPVYSEGILANPRNEQKLSMKERLGRVNHAQSHGVDRKRVTFETPLEREVRNGSNNRTGNKSKKSSVFNRLGYNRN